MSNRISDLNVDNEDDIRNIQNLSNDIQREIDDGRASNYLDNNNLESLQQMQLQQLKELQKIQESQLKSQVDSDDESVHSIEVNKKKKKDKKSKKSMVSGMLEMIQEPLVILILYIAISHKFTLNNLGKYIPNLVSEDGDTITNLLMRGIMLVSIYFVLKMVVLK